MYCESWSLWCELLFAVWLHDHLIMWSCCLWALQCNAWSVYVSITCAYHTVTALSMRLFSSSDKHSLQKIRSQNFIQINLVVNLNTVLNLVHDAQMTESRENTLIYLLLDVKEAFDHVTLKQLIKILIKSINLINWVKCFLQN